MSEKKSILEEALLDIKNIEKALNNNTKEILRSVAKEEIDTVVKESLSKKMEEEMYEEEVIDESMHSEELTEEDEMSNEGEEIHEEEMNEYDSLNEIDLTSASDDDIISVYKKLTGDDEIEIVDGDIHISVSEPGEYIIKTSQIDGLDDESEMEDMDDMDDMEDMEDDSEMEDMEDMEDDSEMEDMEDMEDETEVEEEPEYEIEMGDDEEEDEDEEEESEEDEEEETIEEYISTNRVAQNRAGGDLTDTKGPGAKQGAKFQKESVIAKKIVTETAKKYNALLDESRKLKAENEQFRVALKEFRTKLVETVVFNSNLTYVTKLFTEHSTTKSEKENIIKRFDNEVTNLKESKKLYKAILNELDNRKPINESVENKIIKEVTTGTSKQLTENTAYVDPSTKRILDLINRVEKK